MLQDEDPNLELNFFSFIKTPEPTQLLNDNRSPSMGDGV